MISVIRPSLPMRINAFGAKSVRVPSAVAASTRGKAARCSPSRNPPPAAAPVKRIWRRDIWPMVSPPLGSRRFASCLLDGLSDARIGAAAANVPRQRLVDIGVGGRGYLREQRGGGHDLAGLARSEEHTSELQSLRH